MSLKENEILAQIAQLIASLPSDYLLQPDLMTKDQIREWHESRNTQLLIAECWEAKFIVKEGDPIAIALDKKEISKHKYELIWLTVDRYKAQWELGILAEPYLKKAHSALQYISCYANKFPTPISQLWNKFFKTIFIKDYPFKSSYDLFVNSLEEEVNGSFSWCLRPYYDVTIKKWAKGIKQLIRIFEQEKPEELYTQQTPIEVENLKSNFGWDKLEFSWMGMTLIVCQFAVLSDPLLRTKLIQYYKLLQETFKLAATISRKLPGFAWKRGKVVYASEKGGVYPED
ncbi:hypothetical protein NDI49_23220 [Trichocoleus sp. ST-U3]|uniref:hypothetical protein n=1 Tax=Coleofasciculus sp. FACHB-542 TaxID=2692787 RepID=UPI001688E6B6|nr:hypothetical protein [Coleofasciculus sp. FACHB-542]MBD2087920.1 hypothetical protein [Coleofasciculus sp. FACHB-542]